MSKIKNIITASYKKCNLKELGVDIIWLSPIYQSPFVDQGYDISDYYKIAEEFGTMEEFDELLAETKKRDIPLLFWRERMGTGAGDRHVLSSYVCQRAARSELGESGAQRGNL